MVYHKIGNTKIIENSQCYFSKAFEKKGGKVMYRRKKTLLGRTLSMVLAAAMMVTGLPVSGIEAQAAQHAQNVSEVFETEEATESEASQESVEENSKEENTSEAETESEENSKEEMTSEEESKEEKTNSETEEAEQEESEVKELGEVFTAEPPFIAVGTFPGLDWNQNGDPNFEQIGDSSKYSITIKNVPAGDYEYKILQNAAVNGWDKPWATTADNYKYTVDATADITITIDANDDKMGVDVKKDYVKDIVLDLNNDIQKGVEAELPVTCTYFDGKGNKVENAAVTYSVNAAGVSIKDGKLLVENTYEEDTVKINATSNGFTKEFELKVVSVLYNYTIYYYNPDYTKDQIDLWLWETNGAGADKGTPFTGEEVLADGNTWMKAEVALSFSNVSLIPRIPGWSWQDDTKAFVNKEDAKELVLYIIPGDTKVYTELPAIKTVEKRYLIVEYKRNDGSAKDWYFYTWNNGGKDFNPFEQKEDGSWIATVEVKQGLSSVSYCMERADVAEDGTISHWAEKDGNDYLCSMPVDQNVVKIVMEEGKGITKTYAYNKGYEIEPLSSAIHFYYRSNDKFAKGSTGGYSSVQLEVNGDVYDMVFDKEEQRYTYDLENIQSGEYAYRYILKENADSEKEYVIDAYNTEKVTKNNIEYSLCKYEKFDVEVEAKVYNDSMDYNDNNVLSVSFKAKDGTEIEGMEAKSAIADLSELGGSSKTAIDTALMELTIAVREGTAAGEKTIPVTVFDQYNNEYKTETKVTVKDRVKENDFDWDEAVIYFAVTDRFFDGNESNNGNGCDKSAETGSLSYHGGDFAGLTQKLDYLKDLGINTIWITPIVDNSMSEGLETDLEGVKSWGYHGYWASNLEKLDSHLGTEEEFSALLDEAHKRGMKIMVDVVLNHTGYEASTKEYYNTYIKDENGNPVHMLREEDEMVSGSDQKTSLAGLPDFLTENKEVRELLVEWQSNWISKYPIDYYRVDTVKHVDDTTWSAFKNALTKINPKFKMIGEWAGAGYSTDTGMLGTGRMDSLLDFDFNDQARAFANGKIRDVESFLQGRNAALNNTATLGQFMSSHDEDGLLYKLVNADNISEERAKELFKVAASLQLTAKGQPVIYYGEEVGQYGADNYPYQTNRYDFDWSIANADNEMYVHYKKLLEIRNQFTEVFAKGSRTAIATSDEEKYDVFTRNYGDEKLYVCLNTAQNEKTIEINTAEAKDTVLYDLYSEKYYVADDNGNVNVNIPEASKGGTAILVKTDADNKELSIEAIPSQTYTGKAIVLDENSLVVKYNYKTLKAGKDYKTDYNNNKNAGTATVTVTGKGEYKGKATAEFTINKKNIADADVVLTYKDTLSYNKKAQKALSKIVYNNRTLEAKKDYTVAYYTKADYENGASQALKGVKDAGEYVMVITALEKNFTGNIVKDIVVVNKKFINNASIKLSATSFTYNDYAAGKRPEVKEVKVSGKKIDNSRYDVKYEWNGKVGKATVTVTMKEDDAQYMGSATKSFNVKGVALSAVAKIDTNSIGKVIFDGAKAKTDTGIILEAPKLIVKAKDIVLEEGKDYTISYKNNKKAGKATVIFTGAGQYTGSLTRKFDILPREIKAEDDKLNISFDEEVAYSKAGNRPVVTISYDGIVLDKADFTVKYDKNTKVTENAKITITFKGNYKGKVIKNFNITKSSLENMTITVNDIKYKKKTGNAFATPVIKDETGRKLNAGTDYNKTYVYTYKSETVVENGKKAVTRKAGDIVDKKDMVPKNTAIEIKVTAKENGNYTGSITAEYKVK